MIDQNARNRLIEKQNSKNLLDGISKITDSIKTPFSASEYNDLLNSVAELQTKFEKFISKQPVLSIPKETQLSGEVSVSEVKKLPAVQVTNFPRIEIPKPLPFPKSFDVSSLPP